MPGTAIIAIGFRLTITRRGSSSVMMQWAVLRLDRLHHGQASGRAAGERAKGPKSQRPERELAQTNLGSRYLLTYLGRQLAARKEARRHRRRRRHAGKLRLRATPFANWVRPRCQLSQPIPRVCVPRVLGVVVPGAWQESSQPVLELKGNSG